MPTATQARIAFMLEDLGMKAKPFANEIGVSPSTFSRGQKGQHHNYSAPTMEKAEEYYKTEKEKRAKEGEGTSPPSAVIGPQNNSESDRQLVEMSVQAAQQTGIPPEVLSLIVGETYERLVQMRADGIPLAGEAGFRQAQQTAESLARTYDSGRRSNLQEPKPE